MPEFDEKSATQAGCSLLGEGVVWSIGLAVLLAQIHQDRVSEATIEAKAERNEARIRALEDTCAALQSRCAALEVEATQAVAPSVRQSVRAERRALSSGCSVQ